MFSNNALGTLDTNIASNLPELSKFEIVKPKENKILELVAPLNDGFSPLKLNLEQKIIEGYFDISFFRQTTNGISTTLVKKIRSCSDIRLKYEIDFDNCVLIPSFNLKFDGNTKMESLSNLGISFKCKDIRLVFGLGVDIENELLIGPHKISHFDKWEDYVDYATLEPSKKLSEKDDTKYVDYDLNVANARINLIPNARNFNKIFENQSASSNMSFGFLYQGDNIQMGARYSYKNIYMNSELEKPYILLNDGNNNFEPRLNAYKDIFQLGLNLIFDFIDQDSQLQFGGYYKHGTHDPEASSSEVQDARSNSLLFKSKSNLQILNLGLIASRNNFSIGCSYTNFFDTYSLNNEKIKADRFNIGFGYTQGPIGANVEALFSQLGNMKFSGLAFSTSCNLGWFIPHVTYAIYKTTYVSTQYCFDASRIPVSLTKDQFKTFGSTPVGLEIFQSGSNKNAIKNTETYIHLFVIGVKLVL